MLAASHKPRQTGVCNTVTLTESTSTPDDVTLQVRDSHHCFVVSGDLAGWWSQLQPFTAQQGSNSWRIGAVQITVQNS